MKKNGTAAEPRGGLLPMHARRKVISRGFLLQGAARACEQSPHCGKKRCFFAALGCSARRRNDASGPERSATAPAACAATAAAVLPVRAAMRVQCARLRRAGREQ